MKLTRSIYLIPVMQNDFRDPNQIGVKIDGIYSAVVTAVPADQLVLPSLNKKRIVCD